jgi:hypothetical protein
MPSFESRYHAAAVVAAGVTQGAEGCTVAKVAAGQYNVTFANPIALAEMALVATVVQSAPGAAPKAVVKKSPAATDPTPFTQATLEFRGDSDGVLVDPEGFFLVVHRVKVGQAGAPPVGPVVVI